MKILVTTTYFYPHPGGSQNYIYNLYGQLKKDHPEILVDVVCYNTDGAPKEEKFKGLNIFRVGCVEVLPGQFALPNYIELIGLIKKLKAKRGGYDIVNAHTRFFDNALWTPNVAKNMGAKSILTDHCAYSPRHSSWFVTAVAKVVDLIASPAIASRFDDVVSVSFATKRYLNSLGIKSSKVFHGGVMVKDFALSKGKGKYKSIPNIDQRLSKNDVVVGYLGRLIYSKGPQILLGAAKEIDGEFRDRTHFVFAGDGEAMDSLKASKLKGVLFTGKLNPKQVVDFLGSVDILVLPTIHHEGFPIVLLEAGASGCAVIASDNGGITELIKDGRTGLIAEANSQDVKEKLVKLIGDKSLRTKLGKNLYASVKRDFGWSVISKKFYGYIQA